MIADLMALIICGFFSRIPWVKRKYYKIKERIRIKYNRQIGFERIKLRGFFVLEVNGLLMRDFRKRYSVAVSKLIITISIRNLVGGHGLIRSVELQGGEVKPLPKSNDQSSSPGQDHPVKKEISGLYWRLANKIEKIARVSPASVHLVDFKVFPGVTDKRYIHFTDVGIRAKREDPKRMHFWCVPSKIRIQIVNSSGNDSTGLEIDVQKFDLLMHRSETKAVDYSISANASIQDQLSMGAGDAGLFKHNVGIDGMAKLNESGFFIHEASCLTFNRLQACLSFCQEFGTE
jgi:hypothetical protein